MPDWLDLRVELAHWQVQFHALPCARQGVALEECWPLIEAVYLLYVRHPRATLAEMLKAFEALAHVAAPGLDHEQVGTLFARVWSRILKQADGRALPDWRPGGGTG
jgi:hypothetical protein